MDKNFKRTLIVVVCIVAISLLVYGAYVRGKSSPNNSNMIQSVVTAESLSETTGSTANLQLQEQCAKDAHTTFVNGGYTTTTNGSNSYTDHFNKKLNTCFIVISNIDSSGNYIQLYDAISQQEYGEYAGLFSGKSFLSECVQNAKPTTVCKIVNSTATLDDWQNFIKPYMEN